MLQNDLCSPKCTAVAGVLFFVLGAAVAALAVATVRRKARSHKDIPWWYAALQVAFTALLRVRYRFRVEGLENIPATGGVIVAPNHVSFLDGVVLCALCRRRVRFLIYEGYQQNWFVALVIRVLQLIPVSATRAKSALATAAGHLEAGACIGIFPEGQITRTGGLGEFQGGTELLARRAKVPVLPVALDGLWGSSTSFHAAGGAFHKLPRLGRPPVTLRFGEPLRAPERKGELNPADPRDHGDFTARLRERVDELLAECYAKRPAFRHHLGAICVRALASVPWRVIVIDRGGAKRLALRAATLLALARYVAVKLRRAPDRRIGILLPPGAGAAVANLAVVMLGKSPANLNFTLGRKQFEACIETTETRVFISAAALREKLDERVPDFPWGAMGEIVDIAELLKNAPKVALLLNIALAWVLPGRLLVRLWGVPRKGGHTEAAVLCTSGSSGLPKGVPLSHANILGNCSQFDDTRLIPPDARLQGNLPVFHSFGFTVTLWLPFTRALAVINTPSPLETARNITAIREERVNILIGTPTFYRGYMKKAEPDDMKSVRLIVAGAEKLPAGFADEWCSRFGGRFIEGYGATELTPVSILNVHDVPDKNVRGGVFTGNKPGTVGRPVCGMAARYTSPLDNKPVPGTTGGVLWLKGVNTFAGYLHNPEKTREVLTADGWYCTGDIAQSDADGFITIKGRHSRFSKIGGEMVPHGSVEDAVRKVLGLHFGEDAQQRVAVTARFDEAKGEVLVLLTTLDIDLDDLRAKLSAEGFANLWLPRIVRKVDEIPVLATGKLDLQGMRQLAAEEG